MGLYNRFFKRFFAETEFSPDCAVRFTGAAYTIDYLCFHKYTCFKAVVKYVGGFWPIGVFFAGYRSFFFVPSRQTQTKARL